MNARVPYRLDLTLFITRFLTIICQQLSSINKLFGTQQAPSATLYTNQPQISTKTAQQIQNSIFLFIFHENNKQACAICWVLSAAPYSFINTFFVRVTNNEFKDYHLVKLIQQQLMFQTQFKELLSKISQIEYKLENYRQLLNEEIQFNLKDLYLSICKDSAVTAYHLYQYIDSFPKQMNQQIEEHVQETDSERVSANCITQLESMIKGYNNCTSLNLTFIEFSLIFLSKQNHLLAKLTVQRNSIGNIPFYLRNYARRILLLECQLHSYLQEFRKKYSAEMELWIKQHTILNGDNQKQLDNGILRQYCEQLEIDTDLIIQNLKLLPKQNIKLERMIALLTLKNSDNVKKLLETRTKNTVQFPKQQQKNPYIRPQFNDCLQRKCPQIEQISNFSHRQIKSIEKHMQRIQLKSPNKITISQKIEQFSKKIEQNMKIFCKGVREIVEKERKLQYHRVQLALCTDFYPVLFFNSFQKDFQNSQKQHILPSIFKEYLCGFGVECKLEDVFLLFKRYSTRHDGKLAFNQFCSIFDLSESNQKYFMNIEKNREVKGLHDVDLETKKHYLTVLKESITTESKIQKIKHKLCYSNSDMHGIDLREIFSCIDQDADGFISQTDFKIIFKLFMNFNISKEDIALIWHRFGIKGYKQSSKNQLDSVSLPENEMVTYEKFITEMMPKTKPKRKKTLKSTQITVSVKSPKSSINGARVSRKI